MSSGIRHSSIVNRQRRAAVIVVAAGVGRRFSATRRGGPAGSRGGGGRVRKAFVRLRGRPILSWSLKACEASPVVEEVVVAVHRRDVAAAWDCVRDSRCRKVTAIVPGGATRADSVYCGLQAVSPQVPLVAVHDAARPLVSPALITRVVEAARRCGAALAAVPMVPTTKLVDADQRVIATLDRRRLWAAHTPQAFRRALLLAAYRRLRGRIPRQATDDSALVEPLGIRSRIVEDSPRNLKITTPEDLRIAEALLRG